MAYRIHELASLFPLMEGEPFHELAADIKANGLKEAAQPSEPLATAGAAASSLLGPTSRPPASIPSFQPPTTLLRRLRR
jgi:hypothetical protein